MAWWNQPRRIQILVDNDSWILPWAGLLAERIRHHGDHCDVRRSPREMVPGDIAFLLGCTRLIDAPTRALNRRNLVVHESDLPAGRGFAPMTWQVLEGARTIPVCLLEAVDPADAGDIFLRHEIHLSGRELCDELRVLQGQATVDICLAYLQSASEPLPCPQQGIPSHWPRRQPDDSQLDVNRTIAGQFDLLRVCDNERYPAWFEFRGQRYEIRIQAAAEEVPATAAEEVPATAAESPPRPDTSPDHYVVAGCKSWNRETFDQCSPRLPGTWHYVGSREELQMEQLQRIRPAMLFFLHWSWRVPREILANYPCVCFHMTDVPYGRGGSPLQNLIVRGHRRTQLSALRMTDQIDAGPVYLKRTLDLAGTAAEILRRASELSFAMIGEIIESRPEPVPQSGTVTPFARREPAQSQIPGHLNLVQLFDHIRMLDGEGYPPAFLDAGHHRYELVAPQLSRDGQSISARVTVRLRSAAHRHKAS